MIISSFPFLDNEFGVIFLCLGINVIFNSIVASMNKAGTVLAEANGGTYNPVNFDVNYKAFDVSEINNGGSNLRMDTEAAKQIAKAAVDTLKSNAEADLTRLRRAVENCGFRGANMPEALQNSLNQIKRNINDAITNIADTFYKFVDVESGKVADTASQISRAFSGGKG